MAKNLLNVTSKSGAEQDNLQIDIPRQNLGAFLSSFLGQPRRTRKTFIEPFSIDHSFICNLDRIIDQRVAGQQRATLTSFTASIYFDDGREQTETSREAFQAFKDTSLSRSKGLTVIWTYLVEFPGRDTPEKQEIELNISTDRVRQKSYDPGRKFSGFFRWILEKDEYNSDINIAIFYTELTWGIDLLRYVENEIKKSFTNSNVYIDGIRSWLRGLALMWGPLILIFVPQLLLLERSISHSRAVHLAFENRDIKYQGF